MEIEISYIGNFKKIVEACENLFEKVLEKSENKKRNVRDKNIKKPKIIKLTSREKVIEKYKRILNLSKKVAKLGDYEMAGIVLRVLIEESLDINHLANTKNKEEYLERLILRDYIEERNFLNNSKQYTKMRKDNIIKSNLMEDDLEFELKKNDDLEARKKEINEIIKSMKKELGPKNIFIKNTKKKLRDSDYTFTTSEKLNAIEKYSKEKFELFKTLYPLGNFHVHNSIKNIYEYDLKPHDFVIIFGIILVYSLRDTFHAFNILIDDNNDFKILNELMNIITTHLIIYIN